METNNPLVPLPLITVATTITLFFPALYLLLLLILLRRWPDGTKQNCTIRDGTKLDGSIRYETVRYGTVRNANREQGSPDYSEYGYEPEFELQGDREHDPNADAETLAKWREEKLLENDRWQFGKYGKQNVGSWIGES